MNTSFPSLIKTFCSTLFIATLAIGCEENEDDTERTDDVNVQDAHTDTTTMTPAEERRETLGDLERMRDRLTRELDEVRAKLNDGALTPEERERNTSRAATLAQGLERLDRTIVDLNTSTEDNWINLRTDARKSRDDYRQWLRENEVRE
jgi:hypothetical protein